MIDLHNTKMKLMYPLKICILSILFFFQAEDGIRDRNVTGVQTCALPIFWRSWPPRRREHSCRERGGQERQRRSCGLSREVRVRRCRGQGGLRGRGGRSKLP